MPTILFLLVLALVARECASQNFSLSVVYTTQIRGMVMPSTQGGAECTTSQVTAADTAATCLGGAARRKTFADTVRSQVNNSLVIDGGSSFFGTFFYRRFGTAYMAELTNRYRPDVIAVGDTDFHAGPETYGDYLSRLDPAIPIIASNLDVSGEPALNGDRSSGSVKKLLPYSVQFVAGTKIGVVSNVTPRIFTVSSPGPNVKLNSNSSTEVMVRITIAQILRVHPDCAIFVYLCNDDAEECFYVASMLEHLDVVLVSDLYLLRDRVTPAPLPQFITNVFGEQILVAGVSDRNGISALRLDLIFDSTGRLVQSTAKATYLTPTAVSPPQGDPTLWNNMVLRAAEITAWQAQPIGWANGTIFGERGVNLTVGFEGCRWSDCPMARVINQIMLWWCKDCDISVWNGGNVRASWPAGNVTLRQVLQVLPFGNTASYFKCKGSVLINALVNGISLGGGNGRFIHAVNIRYAWNPDINIPASKRLVRAEFFDRSRQAWVQIDPQRIYKIATNNFMRQGGDQYSMFVTSVSEPFDLGPIDVTIVNDYFLQYPVVQAPSREDLQTCLQWINPDKGMWAKNTWPMAGRDAGPCLIVPVSYTGDSDFGCPTSTSFCRNLFSQGGSLFGAPFITNVSQCSRECSGLGKCLEAQCACQTPTTGLFQGLPMIRGVDCTELRTVLDLSDSARLTVYVLAGISVAVIIAVAIGIIAFRAYPIIRATSPIFGIMTCLGALVGVASVIVVVQPTTDQTCSGAVWLTSFTFIILFSSVFVKAYRIDRIFNHKGMEVVLLPDIELGGMMVVMLILDVGILLAWQLMSPIQAHGYTLSTEWSARVVCTSENSLFYSVIIYLYHGILLLWGLWLAVRTRKVEKNFNESRFIGLALYNLTFVCSIVIPILYVVGTTQYELTLLLRCISTLYVVVFTVLTLFASRFYAIYKGQGLVSTHSVRGATAATELGNSNPAIDPEALLAENANLKRQAMQYEIELAKLRQQVIELGGQLRRATVDNSAIFISESESSPPLPDVN